MHLLILRLKKTSLTTEQIVFFPLHILVDDGHADLLQQGFEKYLHTEPESCANAMGIVKGMICNMYASQIIKIVKST